MEIVQNLRKIVLTVAVTAVLLFVLAFAGKIWENVDADEIACIQSPISGKLNWYTSAGVKWQGFGKVTKYFKLDTYEFRVPVRFNDGGHGTIVGSLNYEVPLSVDQLTQIHMKYGSQEAIQKQLVETVTNKCVYMTGPLMSSKESYAEKRTSLIFYIEDQIQNGVYRTTQKDIKTRDPITGVEKTVAVVEIVKDDKGQPARQEDAVLSGFGIDTSNFAVTRLDYEDAVERQIQQQQELTMKVQTAVAASKEAEQRAITVAKEGEANAASAKWAQEVEKAKAVTLAQQQFEVAALEAKAAEQKKRAEILLGEGEATRKRLVMQADGALEKKLAAYVETQKNWADAMARMTQPVVPGVSMGGDGKGGNGVTQMMEILGAKAARDLQLELKAAK
ncbi:MAG: hypothetical protein E6Q99_09360 [Elusimicrobia bacterium]|jgi:hypothetical protein|nr:MAG: hypothetical protein E6Q99_09360 [Elusimicrobiota bacterium]